MPILLQAMIGFGMFFIICATWVGILLFGIVVNLADKSTSKEVKRKRVRRKLITIIVIVAIITWLIISIEFNGTPIN